MITDHLVHLMLNASRLTTHPIPHFILISIECPVVEVYLSLVNRMRVITYYKRAADPA